MKSKLIMITIAVITALTLMTACAEIDLGLGDDWFQPLFPNSASESASSPSADSAGAGVTSVGTSDSGQSTDGSQSASAANSASASQSASSSGGQGDAPVAFEDYDDISDRTFTSSMPAMLTGKGHYEIDTTVKKCYFDKSSLLYDKRVAMFSFALAVATDTEANLKSFFSGAGFDADVLTVDYDKTPTADTMAYGIAKKDMNGFTLVAVACRGFNYGAEWASNFTLGTGEDHEGFKKAATCVVNDLKDFLTDNDLDLSKTKLLLTGYSRGGGIANVCTALIKTTTEFSTIGSENLFAYTFEAPQGNFAPSEDKNVYNIVNKEDIVTYIAPRRYDMYRVGVDVEVYHADYEAYAKQLDADIRVAAFTGGASYGSGAVLYTSFLAELTKATTQEGSVSLATKSDYAANLEPSLSHGMGWLEGLSASQKSVVTSAFKDFQMISDSLTSSDPQALYSGLKPKLDAGSIPYNDDNLKFCCNQIQAALSSFYKETPMKAISLLSTVVGNIDYIKTMHSPEVIYGLLKNS